jgi:hypothetical protein
MTPLGVTTTTQLDLVTASAPSTTTFTLRELRIVNPSTATWKVGSLGTGITVGVLPVALNVSWSSTSGTTFRVVVSGVTVLSSTTATAYKVTNLSPGTSYTVKVLTSVNGTFVLESDSFQRTVATPAFQASNAADVKSAYTNANGKVDLSTLRGSQLTTLVPLLTASALSTGDKIAMSARINGSKTELEEIKYVALGGTTAVNQGGAVLTPFSSTGGSSQTLTLTIGGESTSVVYDATAGTLAVGGTTRSVGDSFVSGGFVVTIVEV